MECLKYTLSNGTVDVWEMIIQCIIQMNEEVADGVCEFLDAYLSFPLFRQRESRKQMSVSPSSPGTWVLRSFLSTHTPEMKLQLQEFPLCHGHLPPLILVNIVTVSLTC